MPTYNDVYLDIRRKLLAAGISQAELEARELICYASGKPRETFRRDLGLYFSDDSAASAYALCEKRLQGVPIAYLTGSWEFMGHEFLITPNVLIPRSDTELLCEEALQALPAPGMGKLRVLDLCAGSGCIGIAMALERKDLSVTLADLSEGAMNVAKENVRRFGLLGRVACVRADALQPLPEVLGSFDLIVTNPPYIPTAEIETLDSSVKDQEPRMALDGGKDGLDFYRAIFLNARRSMRRGGKLLCELGIGQCGDAAVLLLKNGWRSVEIYRDLSGIQRVLKCEK